ncbi:hypothetical protein DPMN_122296 [Dreissena polymorpha]|uniref:Uncharacterized protein n=1 Tax=Dreissena polymorpha TaxID=45954 RepID=A0A9D4JUC6_DREPO|nr:hypothetical protein DPMN_122296 [Dreissena polymorpha]
MSVLEPRMSDLRSGFGGMGFGLGTPGASGVSPMPLPGPSCGANLLEWCRGLTYGLAPLPLPTSGLLDRFPAQPSPPDICREPVDHRASPGKQLPSKMNKHERIRTWLEVSSKPQKYEKEPAISSHQPNGSSHL